jgi:site-specific recombinase XerC
MGCGLRRRELTDLELIHIQRCEDHWAIIDLIGKGGPVRTVRMPDWVKQQIDEWLPQREMTVSAMYFIPQKARSVSAPP